MYFVATPFDISIYKYGVSDLEIIFISIMWCSIVLIVAIALLQKAECVAEFGDCTGGKKCDSGLTCYSQTQYYSQCLKACPTGWQCSTGGGATSTNKPLTTSNKPVATTTGNSPAPTGNRKALTNDCSFGFGAAFDGNSRDYSQVDYATIWIGTISPYVSCWSGKCSYVLALLFAVNSEQTLTSTGMVISFAKWFLWANYQCKSWVNDCYCTDSDVILRSGTMGISSPLWLATRLAYKIVTWALPVYASVGRNSFATTDRAL